MAPHSDYYLKVNDSHLDFFQALASKTRLQIINLLLDKNRSISELSGLLDLSSAVVTKHVNILENVGIITSISEKGIRGRLKICQLNKEEVVLIFNSNKEKTSRKFIEKNIPIGSYYDFKISAPCGITSNEKILGYVDNPNLFYFPEREKISLLWFTSGYISYNLPIYDINFNNIKSVEISCELCSEYAGYNNNFKSDIEFYLDDILLTTWTSPGDFGDRKGKLTPKWWELGTEYGILKTIKVDNNGTFLDGVKVNNLTLEELLKDKKGAISFKISSPDTTIHPGGVNLFGKDFGDYNQDINVKFFYE
ncbi:ArsR/SmtB family transcription factor [Lederbergia lenta]|uniref:Transcriptional regulator n=1 Tax=Lederbergia lenta TaxID=1467 RepID=A0A2X4VYM8_LEDLE|nr:ArsR family transcriptional regulator [Lederbergia lenta]MEC2323454.1 ArsR family transcriptional regulator [Lederbergia lenta]SQI52988.1 transcriptional regulator [Lederbergia lenta]